MGLVRPEVKDFVAYWTSNPTGRRTGPTGPPPDPAYFGVRVMLLIGPPDDTADAFDCFVCTPGWLADHVGDGGGFDKEGLAVGDLVLRPLVAGGAAWPLRDGGLASMSGTILMPRWSKDALLEAVDQVCNESVADDWMTAATRIGRVFPWEFQYRYDRFIDVHPDRFAIPPWNDPSHRLRP